MKKRTVLINFRATKDEAAALTERAKGCGYSRETYIRSVLNGRVPRPMPTLDYHAIMQELHGIGNNMNQIAQKAHILNVVDAGRYDTAFRSLIDLLLKIEEAVKLPDKME